jgi:hypothetical protein
VSYACFVRIRFTVQQRLGGYDEPWRTDAALERCIFQEAPLERVQVVAFCDALDRDYFATLRLGSEHAAGVHQRTIEDHVACAAVAVVASFLGTSETDDIAQDVE